MKPWTVTPYEPSFIPETYDLGVYKVEPFYGQFLDRMRSKSDFDTALKDLKDAVTEDRAITAIIEMTPLIVETLIKLGDYCMKNVKNPHRVKEINEMRRVLSNIGTLNRGII